MLILRLCLIDIQIHNEDVILKRKDVISIPEKKNYVSIIGQVVNPGNLVYAPNLKVNDYIQLAGGFSWRAIEGDVRVIKVNTGEWVDADDVESLDPGIQSGFWKIRLDQNSGTYF
ncbi:MAG: SLBB domain-containing protein [Ignavibacteriales bacterium]|nr:SLBB domain-containing protein [Ignavibacteriales bacterium]